MIEGSKRTCEECGHETNAQHKFCIYCGGILYNLSGKKSLRQLKAFLRRKIVLPRKRTNVPTKTKISIALIVFISTFLISIFIIGFPTRILPTTVDPEAIEWISVAVTNPSFENAPWAKIVESNYAIEGKNLYFLIKWNGSVPVSIKSNDILAPRYLIYRKVEISWTIYEDGNLLFSEGKLNVGHNFLNFEFTKDTNFQLSNSYPFINETTVALSIIYKKGVIPIESLSQIRTTPTIEYIAYHKFQSNLRSLTEIAESPSNNIILDGNLSDWSNSNITYDQMNGDPINGEDSNINEIYFPQFDNIRVTRTAEGIYGAVSLVNKNFTKFIKERGNLSVEIDWATALVEINGSFEADYAFGVSATFDQTIGYSIQEVYITLVAGTTSPTVFEKWQLQENQSGTNACLEFIFPADIISDLYGQADKIFFNTIMIIVWK